MPVKGNIYVVQEDCTLEKMEVGSEGYMGIDYDFMTFTRIALFIERTIVIESLENMEQGLYIGMIKIKRIGAGLTDKDFEIDFTECEDIAFLMRPMNIYQDLMEEKDYYVVFPCTTNIVDKKFTAPEATIEDLEGELADAKNEEDWPRAAELRDKIAKMKGENK